MEGKMDYCFVKESIKIEPVIKDIEKKKKSIKKRNYITIIKMKLYHHIHVLYLLSLC